MRDFALLASALLMLAGCDPASSDPAQAHDFNAKVLPSDLAKLTGDDWTGDLTYLNYGEPQQEFTIPAQLAVAQNGNVFELYFSYPGEPQADGRAEVVVSQDGRMLNGERVVRRVEQDEALVLTTEEACDDNGAEAHCKYTYEIEPGRLAITKMVTLDGEGNAFRRNYYSFSR